MSAVPDGIRFLDHTADVGVDVTAGSLDTLFRRAAAGMVALLRGADDMSDPAGEPTDEAFTAESGRRRPGGDVPDGSARETDGVRVELAADDVAGLLAAWLKELLFLHETRHVDFEDAAFDRLTGTALAARVTTRPAAPVREIKGVTHHELLVEHTGDGWRARVIFDV